MVLSKQQSLALDLMKQGNNVFLTGSAGSGKSFIINEFRDQFSENCAVVAPTGVAALNINGQTIHSFFMLTPGLIDIDQLEEIPYRRKRQLINQIDTLIIDEISMVRSDIFAAIDKRLRQVAVGKNKLRAFGGKQIICCGDFFQLSPIVNSEIENSWLNEHFNGEYAFNTDSWNQAKFKTVILDKSFRQENDKLFINVLNNIRHGKINEQNLEFGGKYLSSYEVLNQKCIQMKQMPHIPIKLCTTNREAQNFNNEAYMKNQNIPYLFEAEVEGKFDQIDYPTDPRLMLKEGLRVMILVNKRRPKGDFLYVNGDCGIITKIVKNDIETYIGIMLDKGYEVKVSCHEWQKIKYVIDTDLFSGKKIIRQEIIGSFIQLPLRLAYAITIHKSQGMTLDSVDLRLGSGCFAHGQLYTALSRVKSLDGLMIERKLDQEDLILDNRVIDFYKSINDIIETDSNKNISMDIPIEYESQIKDFLAKLKNQIV